jgi:hypothetical protein
MKLILSFSPSVFLTTFDSGSNDTQPFPSRMQKMREIQHENVLIDFI